MHSSDPEEKRISACWQMMCLFSKLLTTCITTVVLITWTKNLDIANEKKQISMINPVKRHHELNLSGETKSFFFSGWRCKSGSKWMSRMLILTLKHPIIWISGSRWLFALSCRMVPKCMKWEEQKWSGSVCRLFWKRKTEMQSLVTPGFPSFYWKEPAEFTRSFRGETAETY